MDILIMLKAIGEPTRFKIFQQLLERKHCVRSLSKKMGISESAVSQHMKILRNAGLVYGIKYGYHTHYLPSQNAIDFMMDYFKKMQDKSVKLNRDMTVCQCEFRKKEDEDDK